MHNDKGQVTDWLEQIVKEPDEWILFFSSSEVKMLAEDALELLKTYSEILNKEPFQCKDCEYYGNKHKCPCYETKYPILNFSCADGVRKNREWLSD